MTGGQSTKDGGAGSAEPRTAAEWVSLGVALLVLAGVIGAVVVVWLSPRQAPPRFVVEGGAVRREGERYYLKVTIRNQGDVTASEVLVIAVLSAGSEERASTTFDFIPGRSAVEAVLVFGQDPAMASVQVRSFQKP